MILFIVTQHKYKFVEYLVKTLSSKITLVEEIGFQNLLQALYMWEYKLKYNVLPVLIISEYWWP